MFGKRESRRHKAERIASQAWDNLSSVVDSAGSSTRSATKKAATMLDETTGRVGYGAKRVESGAKEARRRANAAYDALAGRQKSTPWGWLAAAALVGAAVGWLGNMAGRRLMPGPDQLELPDTLADDTFGQSSVTKS